MAEHKLTVSGLHRPGWWPASEAVVTDTTPPEVHAVHLRQGYLEIELDEEPDLSTVQTAGLAAASHAC